MKRFAALAAAFVCLVCGGAARAQTAVGDWVGTLVGGPATTFHLAVHIRKSGDKLTGTLDDVSRAIAGFALTDVSLAGDTLSFKVPVPSAAVSYAAKWDAASGHWIGQWTQSGQPLPLTLSPGVQPPLPTIAGLDGAWDGVLAAGATLHLTLHVKTGAGGTAAWMDSVDQMTYGLDIQDLKREGDTVSFAMAALKAAYAGTLAADAQSLTGQFTQGGGGASLTLHRRAPGAQPAGLKRPQTPVKPYPYKSEDVAFEDAEAHVKLSGTLTAPQDAASGPGPFPAVVLIAGSGPNTRDEPLMGHKFFLVLADWLTRHGIAVLRYDKRGTGASGGDYAKATTMDFAADAEAAAAYLRGRPEIDPRRVGLIGHSEGGLIAPMVAVKDPKIAFIVLMAGPGVDGLDVLNEQGRLIARAMGLSDAMIAQSTEFRGRLFDIARSEKDQQVAAVKLKAAADAYAKANGVAPEAVELQAGLVNSDWFRFFYDYDPAVTLRQVRCPVLALIGSKDLQVAADQNLPPIRAALAHDPQADVEELPGLNHLFQTARTGSPGEYVQIEETIAPLALETIAGWIAKHDGRAKPT
jgi:pimeloyl-ACP methyl ester carboxylesterase